METIAIYGKGGIGNLWLPPALAFTMRKTDKVLHVSDPKHDSAMRLLKEGQEIRTVLDIAGRPEAMGTEEILTTGRYEIDCCEAGGPPRVGRKWCCQNDRDPG